MGTSAVVRVIEQCCFNIVPDPFNGQTVNFFKKTQKIDGLGIERIWNTIETLGSITLTDIHKSEL